MAERQTLTGLRKAAVDCRACPLWRDATQTVFGAGSARAVAMFVGEQPGDREDRESAPFVGLPAAFSTTRSPRRESTARLVASVL